MGKTKKVSQTKLNHASCSTVDLNLTNAPSVPERFCSQNWQAGGADFNLWSRLSTLADRSFPWFLQNLRKYRLGSLRKTPKEATQPTGQFPKCGRLALFLQTNPIRQILALRKIFRSISFYKGRNYLPRSF